MSFLNSLTEEQKQAILEDVKLTKSRDIYRLCAILGIDSDTFDPEDYVSPSPVVQHETVLLEQACKAYLAVASKLEG
jgi:hypothetical protein